MRASAPIVEKRPEANEASGVLAKRPRSVPDKAHEDMEEQGRPHP